MIARASSIETSPHAFLSHAQQFLLFFTDLTDWEGPRVIANPSVNRGTRVDRKDIPIAKNRFRGRNAVDNLIIDRGANRTRESAVSLESRDTPFERMVSSASSSSSSVETPGFACSPRIRSTFAERRPASRIASISSGDFKITALALIDTIPFVRLQAV